MTESEFRAKRIDETRLAQIRRAHCRRDGAVRFELHGLPTLSGWRLGRRLRTLSTASA